MPNYRTQTEFMSVRTITYGANSRSSKRKIIKTKIPLNGKKCVAHTLARISYLYCSSFCSHFFFVKQQLRQEEEELNGNDTMYVVCV